MVTVKIDRKTGKCEIIDDAEKTPGSSRQITKFKTVLFADFGRSSQER